MNPAVMMLAQPGTQNSIIRIITITLVATGALIGGLLLWTFGTSWIKRKDEEAKAARDAAESERLARIARERREAGLPGPPGGNIAADKEEARSEADLSTCASCVADQPLWGFSIFKSPEHWAKYNLRCGPAQQDCAKAGQRYNLWSVDKLIPPNI